MSNSLISILMPVYNVAPYIERALSSLRNQSTTDLQIVVVNDCSTDDTVRVVQAIAQVDPRVKVISTTCNGGIVSALNTGLPFCEAPFIARMDGDDVALPDRLEKQLAFLRAHPEVSLVGCATTAIDCDDKPLSGSGISQVPIGAEAISRTLLLSPPCSHIWMARRELYEALCGYRALAPAEDYDFLLRAAASGFLLGNLAEPLMKIRIRPGNCADVAGLRQRKAHRYVTNLYKERISRGTDSFTPEGLARFVQSSGLETHLHSYAVKLVKVGFDASSRLQKVALLALAALLSRWQAKYFIDRACQRMVLRLYNATREPNQG